MSKTSKKSPGSGVSCDRCPALCCQYIATQIDEPTTKKEYDNIRWYLMHRDVFVFIDYDDDWYLEFATRCDNLGTDNRCQVYENRPRICRQHGDTEVDCEFHGEAAPHQIRFSDANTFEAWLDERGTKWRRKSNS